MKISYASSIRPLINNYLRMKIAYLLGSLNRGGTETLMLDVFRNAQKNGLDAICIYRKNGVFEDEFLRSGVPMFSLTTGKNIIGYLCRLRKQLKTHKIDVVHAQQPIDALYAKLACFGTSIKIVLTLHGYDYNESKIGARILRNIIHRTHSNIYVSNTQREYYIEKYQLNPNFQQVVYNGISFDKFDFSDQMTTNLRNELKLSPTTLLLGSVGNFNEVRDQMTICRFLRLLREQQVDFHFVFAGKRIEALSYLYDNCVDYCVTNGLNNFVTFLGVRNDIPSLLSQLDAFVYSTDHDTFGIAVVEAMASGVPAFVNNWGVMNEITGYGNYATLYKTKDENDLLREFMLFLQNKKEYQQKANQQVDLVRLTYSIEKHIEQLKIVYSL